MKSASMRKFSILGLVLIGASAVMAAVLPKNEPRKQFNGTLAGSANGAIVNQLTCVTDNDSVFACTKTAGSSARTTNNVNATSLLATGGRTNTGAAINSSQSPS